jgi:hypothetical protein
MTRPIRQIGLAAGLLALSLQGAAFAYDAATLASPAGMQVQAWIEGDDRLVIGITPADGVKLNGALGVAISADQADPWVEGLPLVITDEGEYFEAPFSETVSFDPDRLDAPTTLTLEYGACQIAMSICVFEETEILVHPNGGGTPDLTLTTVVP